MCYDAGMDLSLLIFLGKHDQVRHRIASADPEDLTPGKLDRAIRFAIADDEADIAGLLLDVGADLDTALCCAVSHYNEAMTVDLLQRGADAQSALNVINSKYEIYEEDLQDPDVSIDKPARRRLLTILLQHGLDPAQPVPDKPYGDGDTLLHTMCRYGSAGADIKLLLEYDHTQMLANSANNTGETPLQCYCSTGLPLRLGVVRTLLEHGADATLPNGSGKTLMQQLERHGGTPDGLRDILVEAGA